MSVVRRNHLNRINNILLKTIVVLLVVISSSVDGTELKPIAVEKLRPVSLKRIPDQLIFGMTLSSFVEPLKMGPYYAKFTKFIYKDDDKMIGTTMQIATSFQYENCRPVSNTDISEKSSSRIEFSRTTTDSNTNSLTMQVSANLGVSFGPLSIGVDGSLAKGNETHKEQITEQNKEVVTERAITFTADSTGYLEHSEVKDIDYYSLIYIGGDNRSLTLERIQTARVTTSYLYASCASRESCESTTECGTKQFSPNNRKLGINNLGITEELMQYILTANVSTFNSDVATEEDINLLKQREK